MTTQIHAATAELPINTSVSLRTTLNCYELKSVVDKNPNHSVLGVNMKQCGWLLKPRVLYSAFLDVLTAGKLRCMLIIAVSPNFMTVNNPK